MGEGGKQRLFVRQGVKFLDRVELLITLCTLLLRKVQLNFGTEWFVHYMLNASLMVF